MHRLPLIMFLIIAMTTTTAAFDVCSSETPLSGSQAHAVRKKRIISADVTPFSKQNDEDTGIAALLNALHSRRKSAVHDNAGDMSLVPVGGTTARTMKERAADVYDVMAYGAKGDCAADDRAAIQNAMNAAATATMHAGRVVFPWPRGGCYLVNAPLIFPHRSTGFFDADVHLEGPNTGGVVIRAGNVMEAVIESNAVAWNRGHSVSDLTLDANGLAQHALWWKKGGRIHVNRTKMLNAIFANARFDDGEVFVANNIFWNQAEIFTNNKDIAPYNLYVTGTDSHFNDNIFYNARTANVFDSGGNSKYIGNHGYGFPKPYYPQYGYISAGSSTFIGNSADGATEAGFKVTGFNTQIISNRVQLAPMGVHIAAGVGSALVTNNTIIGIGDATKYIVQDASPGSGTIVANNPGAAYANVGPIVSGFNQSNDITKIYGAIGSFSLVKGQGSFAVGDNVNDQSSRGRFTRANGSSSFTGDAQVYDVVQRGSGTSGTVNILSTGSGAPFTDRIISLRVDIVASAFVRVRLNAICSTGDSASWTTDFTIKNNKSAASVVFVDAAGANTPPSWTKLSGTIGASNWIPTVVLDTTNGGAYLQGSNSSCAGGKTVYWVADVHVVDAGAGVN